MKSSKGDYPEDFPHENGRYLHNCNICKEEFIGYKRRITCKVCFEKEPCPDFAALFKDLEKSPRYHYELLRLSYGEFIFRVESLMSALGPKTKTHKTYREWQSVKDGLKKAKEACEKELPSE